MTQAFQNIKQGLDEAIAHARGNKDGVKLHQPQAVDVSQLRERLGLTQEQFAAILDREHFVKIAKKMPLQQWQDASIFITATFKEMIQLMQPLSGAQSME